MAEGIENRNEYQLSPDDLTVLRAVDFRLGAARQVLGDAVTWLEDGPTTPVLLGNIKNLANYFRARQQAIQEILPRMQASKNPDIQAMAATEEGMVETLGSLVNQLQRYLETPSAAAATELQSQRRQLDATLRDLGSTMQRNPAYLGFVAYIKRHNAEASRTAIEFDLKYDLAA